MKKLISLLLALSLILGGIALSESFAADYAAMNEAAASVLVLTLYDEDGNETGTASGFIAFDDSHAITTWLAVRDSASITATSDEGADLGSVKLLGCDSDTNLAILAFDEPTGLTPLTLSDDGSVRRGAACVSIGAQNGYNSISTGNISNSFSEMGYDFIMFTAPISEGASGGALFDENGVVAGVTMMGISGVVGYSVVQNMNFAIGMRHVHELWSYIKDDEPVELSDWAITDINPDSEITSTSGNITFVNNTGYSIVTITADRYANYGQSSRRLISQNWIKNGESIEIELIPEDFEYTDKRVSIRITLNVGGNHKTIEITDNTLDDLIGKTFSVTYNVYSNIVSLEAVSAEPTIEQRHVKELHNEDEGFEIPETIERERNIADNCCVVYNDTVWNITDITIYNTATYEYTVLYRGSLAPGEHITIELPNSFVNNNGKSLWRFTISYAKQGTWTGEQYNTKNQDELCGKFVMLSLDEKTNKCYIDII